MVLMIFLFFAHFVCLQNIANMNNENSYQFKPEPVTKRVTDWVVFTMPDIIEIKRTLLNGSNVSCHTKIIASARQGNAWSAEDIMHAINKESVQLILNSNINKFRLSTTLSDEGKTQPFIFKWKRKTLFILPPDDEDKITPRADKNVAGLVYVLSKVYKQQLNRQECKLLRESI